MTKTAYDVHPTVPLSGAVKAGGFLFFSGQLPFDADGNLIQGDIETQTRHILEGLSTSLTARGATLADVVKTTIWLTDKADFPGFNTVYREFFPKDPPARSTVVSALVLDARIEIEAIAYVGDAP